MAGWPGVTSSEHGPRAQGSRLLDLVHFSGGNLSKTVVWGLISLLFQKIQPVDHISCLTFKKLTEIKKIKLGLRVLGQLLFAGKTLSESARSLHPTLFLIHTSSLFISSDLKLLES